MKQKLLIIGPIGDIGGRELETGFIASTLQDNFEVKILSTIILTSKSQIYDFVHKDKVIPVNRLIFNKSFWYKFLAFFSWLKSSCNHSIVNYTNNNLAKKTGYRNYALKQIKREIDYNDTVFLCAQISSQYIKEVVEYSKSQNKAIFFRTSSEIKNSDKNHKSWLQKVDMFIHHSLSNAKRLEFLDSYNFEIIDQCTFKEEDMLQIEPTSKFKTLLYIGRLSSEKGVLELVQFFKKSNSNLVLKIIGDGILLGQLKNEGIGLENIQLLGYLTQEEIIKHIELSDAIVIPSFEESGPLVGLEAMASARIVISTKVGAMPNRLKNSKNEFWFNINDAQSFENVLGNISRLSASEIREVAKSNRQIYLNNYKISMIKSQYKNTIFKLLKQ